MDREKIETSGVVVDSRRYPKPTPKITKANLGAGEDGGNDGGENQDITTG